MPTPLQRLSINQFAAVRAPGFSFGGGGTLLFSSEGDLRLAVTKGVAGTDRIERRREFIAGKSSVATRYWHESEGVKMLDPQWSRAMHGARRR